MYRVNREPTFTCTVKVKVPTDVGFQEQSCQARFRAIPVAEAGKYDLKDGGASSDFLCRVLIHLDDLVDENDQPIEYDDDVRDQMLSYQWFRTALARTYFSAVSGNA